MHGVAIHWQLGQDAPEEAHFFLYVEGEEVHRDHRSYSREELERRIAAIRAGGSDVPAYYREALAALDDPRAPRSGVIPIAGTV